MNYWLVVYSSDTRELAIPYAVDEKFGEMDCGCVHAYYRRDQRFCRDQLFAADQIGLMIADGVLLNLSELKASRSVENLTQVIHSLWAEKGSRFFESFIGPFSGVCYDAVQNTLTAYGNQTGDAPVFYFQNDSCVLVSNDLNMIEAVMKANAFPRTLDETAAMYLLTFAYMVDDRTLFQEIKRLSPGDYLTVTDGDLRVSTYHRFSFQPTDITFDEAIEKIDAGFRKAVKRCFSKDWEYRTPYHLVDMSGGLDSRMNAWVAHDMGYDSAIYLTYCQFGSDELRFASKVAETLNGQLFYKQLNDASFIYEIDRLIDRNYGMSIAVGSTGNDQFLRMLDANQFGLEHSGQIGDVVIGSFGSPESQLEPSVWKSLQYSHTVQFTPPVEVLEKFQTYEEFAMYARGFHGALSSHLIRRHNAYVVSPFLDPEFLQLCESIPLEYRVDHKLYYAWLDRKYPLAGKLPSTRIRSRKKAFALRCCRYGYRKIGRIARYLGLTKTGMSPNDMNPFDYWYESKLELREFLARYYQETHHLLDTHPGLERHVKCLYTSNKAMDKILAINLLAALKRYFS